LVSLKTKRDLNILFRPQATQAAAPNPPPVAVKTEEVVELKVPDNSTLPEDTKVTDAVVIEGLEEPGGITNTSRDAERVQTPPPIGEDGENVVEKTQEDAGKIEVDKVE
jgi:hypothetical protein